MVKQTLEDQKWVNNDVKQIKDKWSVPKFRRWNKRKDRSFRKFAIENNNEEPITELHSAVNELRRTAKHQQAALTNLEDRSRKTTRSYLVFQSLITKQMTTLD